MTGLMREMTGLEKLRELAEAIKQGEDRKAIARVREKGGVNALSMGFQDADNRRVELCAALDIDLDMGWSDAMAAMRRRLMPEGMEWPCFEDGEPVRFGDVVSDGYETGRVYYVTFDTVNPVIIGFTDETPDQDPGTWLEVSVNDGERVKRPERKDSRPDGCCHPGSYECDELAFRNQNSGEDVYADKCLVPELRRLRESGIRTLGSCCGHGTTRPNIVVAPECEGAMRRQGYEGRRNKFGVLEFAAKSSCPAPKVLDADGAEIRVGDTVCGTRDMEPMRVVDTDSRECGFKHIKCEKEGDGFWFYCPDELTHKLPVLAADGKPLREGETVWDVDGRGPLAVWSLPEKSDMHVSLKKDGTFYYRHPDQLTHERPDSWERIEADCMQDAKDYCEEHGIEPEYPKHIGKAKCEDLVRRCKELARKENSNE